MLSKLTKFFQTLSEPHTAQKQTSISLEIACAVLLCEIMRADGKFSNEERTQIKNSLHAQFSLSDAEIDEVINHALEHSEQAIDFFQFTSKINSHYTIKDRIEIVKLLWKVALADGKISSVEEHTIRRIADLLHLRHGEYIKTKPMI